MDLFDSPVGVFIAYGFMVIFTKLKERYILEELFIGTKQNNNNNNNNNSAKCGAIGFKCVWQ